MNGDFNINFHGNLLPWQFFKILKSFLFVYGMKLWALYDDFKKWHI